MSEPYISLFSAPKDFEGLFEVIQHNAIQSWCLQDNCEVTLLGNDLGVSAAAQRHNIRHIPDIPCSAKGPPFMNGIFGTASAHAQSDLVAYINADVMLTNDLATQVRRATEHEPNALMIAQRWDLDLKEPLSFGEGWADDLRQRARDADNLMPPWGWDLFVFRKGAFDNMPPFVIGRPYWDQWVIYEARRRGMPVVDLTPSVFSIHQNHDLGEFQNLQHRKASPDGLASEKLMFDSGFKFSDTFAILHPMTHQLTEQGLRRRGFSVRCAVCHWKKLRFLSPFYRGVVALADRALRTFPQIQSQLRRVFWSSWQKNAAR